MNGNDVKCSVDDVDDQPPPPPPLSDHSPDQQPTTKRARRSSDDEKDIKQTIFCNDVKPPALIIDLDSDLGRKITFDNGRSVIIDRQVAEGGFGSIFLAQAVASVTTLKKIDNDHDRKPESYALKRIDCCDSQGNIQPTIVEQCKKEAAVHSAFKHKNLMPLLEIKFESAPEVLSNSQETSYMKCYMLFPYIPTSLRDDISARRLLEDTQESNRRPYTEQEALSIFAGIVDAVSTMHRRGFSHRDIKVENILLRDNKNSTDTPVLMDFGSVGPIAVPLVSRAGVLLVDEDVANHTTLAYRAPELLEPKKKLKHGPSEHLDYGRADVWSLGCVLFAMLYGSSPFEIEWGVSWVGEPSDGTARIVMTTPDLVLGPVPFPSGGTAADRRYGEDIKDLIKCMLNHDRFERLSSDNVAGRVRKLLGGEVKKGRTNK